MAKRKPTPTKKTETLVQRLYRDVLNQRRALIHPLPDDEMNEGLARLSAITADLANAPAETISDLQLKIGVLCSRLRETLNPEFSGELLDYLLADSIRDDLTITASGS